MKDKIDKIIETVLENVIIEGLCNTCSDNDSGVPIVDGAYYDKCRKELEKILKESG